MEKRPRVLLIESSEWPEASSVVVPAAAAAAEEQIGIVWKDNSGNPCTT